MKPVISSLTLRVRPGLMRRSLKFYELLGFDFSEEKHNNGPIHYVSKSESFLFELYPLTQNDGYPQPHARLGFLVSGGAIEQLEKYKDESGKSFVCEKKDYGYLTRDPMGRFIELRLS